MAVQYTPIPELQVPNVNFLGALQQGEAARLAELQAAKTAQAMELAGQKDIREAAKLQSEQSIKDFELASKKYDALINMAPRLNPGNYGAWYKQVTETFPLAAATLPTQYDPEAVKMVAMQGSDLKPQVLQQHFGDTSRFMRIGPTGAAEVVPGTEVTAPRKPEIKEIGGELYSVTPEGATPLPLLPAGRGQAGAFTGGDLTTDLIKQREGYIERPKFDVNAYRAGYGSDTVTLPDGTVQKVTPGMRVSREDAERDLQRRIQTEFVPKAAAKVGEDVWATLPENTRAALTSVAYNYGTVPSRIVPAVQSGNPETIARAIESLAGDNKGINAGRRMQEANIARGTGMPGSRAVPAFAAAGAPTFMGGPEIQPPINMMAPPAAPVNAMAAPQPVAAMPTPPAPPPMQPLTVGTKTQVKGQSNVETTLGKMKDKYDRLDELKAIPKSGRNIAENLTAYFAGTTVGQEVEKARATPAQQQRNELKALRRSLLKDIMSATGASAKELDSNFELKSMLESLSDETMDIDSVRRIIADLSARYGRGGITAPEEAAPPPAAPAATAGPQVIDFSQLPKRR